MDKVSFTTYSLHNGKGDVSDLTLAAKRETTTCPSFSLSCYVDF